MRTMKDVLDDIERVTQEIQESYTDSSDLLEVPLDLLDQAQDLFDELDELRAEREFIYKDVIDKALARRQPTGE